MLASYPLGCHAPAHRPLRVDRSGGPHWWLVQGYPSTLRGRHAIDVAGYIERQQGAKDRPGVSRIAFSLVHHRSARRWLDGPVRLSSRVTA
jgi:hypothetical protein